MLHALEAKKADLSRQNHDQDQSRNANAKRLRFESPEDSPQYTSAITTLPISLLPNLAALRFFNVGGYNSPLSRSWS
jgi:hypothetical protein